MRQENLLNGEKTLVVSPGASSTDTRTPGGTSARHPGTETVVFVRMYGVPLLSLKATGGEILSQTF